MRTLRRRYGTSLAATVIVALASVSASPVHGTEPFRGWAPLKTRPLRAKYALKPTKAVFPQPLVTIPPNPTPYPYGYFGAVGPHANVQAGPGSAPGTRSWSYSALR